MKFILLLTLTFGMSVSTLIAQTNPADPCCNIVGINPANNTVLAKNNTTGRLFVFKTDAMDIKTVKLKDGVTTNTDFSLINAVNGVARKFKSESVDTIRINFAETVGKAQISKHGPSYDLAPCIYNFRLNTITVENVPVERGKETKLKTGVLNIVSEGDWHLYDDTKEKFRTSGNKPKKFALPVGSYQLKLGIQFYPVVIKDGETVEY